MHIVNTRLTAHMCLSHTERAQREGCSTRTKVERINEKVKRAMETKKEKHKESKGKQYETNLQSFASTGA